jgi:hypothetical protein
MAAPSPHLRARCEHVHAGYRCDGWCRARVIAGHIVCGGPPIEIIKRPEIHGFAGSEVIDQGRIAEVADQSNAALRLLHTHSLGIGVLILLVTLAIANLPVSAHLQTALCVLVSFGAIYPLGWAVLAWLIPYFGVEALRGPVEWIFFIPFGGALILGLVGAVGISVIECLRPTRTE